MQLLGRVEIHWACGLGESSHEWYLHNNFIRVYVILCMHASHFGIVSSDLQSRETAPVVRQPALEGNHLWRGRDDGINTRKMICSAVCRRRVTEEQEHGSNTMSLASVAVAC